MPMQQPRPVPQHLKPTAAPRYQPVPILITTHRLDMNKKTATPTTFKPYWAPTNPRRAGGSAVRCGSA